MNNFHTQQQAKEIKQLSRLIIGLIVFIIIWGMHTADQHRQLKESELLLMAYSEYYNPTDDDLMRIFGIAKDLEYMRDESNYPDREPTPHLGN